MMNKPLLFSFSFYMHPGTFTAGTYSHHPLKERKIIWTKPSFWGNIKFNSSPLKRYLPNRKINVFRPSFFRGELSHFGGYSKWMPLGIHNGKTHWLWLFHLIYPSDNLKLESEFNHFWTQKQKNILVGDILAAPAGQSFALRHETICPWANLFGRRNNLKRHQNCLRISTN